jgi:hypothetical protein
VHRYDSSAARNFRQTDIYIHGLYIPWTCDRKNSLHVVSSILHSGLYINTLLSRCKETWARDVWRMWGGGVAGSPWPVKDFKPMPSVQWQKVVSPPRLLSARQHFHTGMRVMGVFDGDCSRGEGVMPTPPPPRQIARRLPRTSVTNTGWGLRHALLAAHVPTPSPAFD